MDMCSQQRRSAAVSKVALINKLMAEGSSDSRILKSSHELEEQLEKIPTSSD